MLRVNTGLWCLAECDIISCPVGFPLSLRQLLCDGKPVLPSWWKWKAGAPVSPTSPKSPQSLASPSAARGGRMPSDASAMSSVWLCEVRPGAPGSFSLNVSMDGKLLAHSPFRFTVVAQWDPAAVTVLLQVTNQLGQQLQSVKWKRGAPMDPVFVSNADALVCEVLTQGAPPSAWHVIVSTHGAASQRGRRGDVLTINKLPLGIHSVTVAFAEDHASRAHPEAGSGSGIGSNSAILVVVVPHVDAEFHRSGRLAGRVTHSRSRVEVHSPTSLLYCVPSSAAGEPTPGSNALLLPRDCKQSSYLPNQHNVSSVVGVTRVAVGMTSVRELDPVAPVVEEVVTFCRDLLQEVPLGRAVWLAILRFTACACVTASGGVVRAMDVTTAPTSAGALQLDASIPFAGICALMSARHPSVGWLQPLTPDARGVTVHPAATPALCLHRCVLFHVVLSAAMGMLFDPAVAPSKSWQPCELLWTTSACGGPTHHPVVVLELSVGDDKTLSVEFHPLLGTVFPLSL